MPLRRIDYTNEASSRMRGNNIDGISPYGRQDHRRQDHRIRHSRRGLSWKSYQESLPPAARNKVTTRWIRANLLDPTNGFVMPRKRKA